MSFFFAFFMSLSLFLFFFFCVSFICRFFICSPSIFDNRIKLSINDWQLKLTCVTSVYVKSNGYVDDHIGWEKRNISVDLRITNNSHRRMSSTIFIPILYMFKWSSKIRYRWDVNFENAYTLTDFIIGKCCVSYLKWQRIEQKKLQMFLYFD